MKAKMRMKIKILFCICCIGILSSCNQINNENDKQDNDVKYAEIEKKAQECNLNTVNYLFCDKERDLNLYFSINVSLLNIQRVDLYFDESIKKNDAIVNQIYDNVINLTITEDIDKFNSIRVYDSNGEHLDFYVGEYYFEQYQYKESNIDTDVGKKIRIEDTDTEVKVIISEEKEAIEKYNVGLKVPQKVKKYFNFDVKKEKESITFIHRLKSQYVGKIQISYEFAVELLDIQTKKVNTKMVFYLPMSKKEL